MRTTIAGRIAEMDGVLPIVFPAVILKIPVLFGLWLIWGQPLTALEFPRRVATTVLIS